VDWITEAKGGVVPRYQLWPPSVNCLGTGSAQNLLEPIGSAGVAQGAKWAGVRGAGRVCARIAIFILKSKNNYICENKNQNKV
jgi:hypothetical protein